MPKQVRAPSLDWLNFLVADVRGALGPFVVVYLVSELHWTVAAVGLVTTLGGWIGLVAQTPIGAWLDHTRRKRGMLITALIVLSAGALVVTWIPEFWPVLIANAMMQVVSGVFEPGIAALTVGLFASEALTRRMGRNAAWSRAGNVVVALSSGALALWVSAKAVFFQVPVIAALTIIAVMTIPDRALDLRRARGLKSAEDDSSGPASWILLLRSGPMLTFAACSFLYELASAPLLTLVGQMVGAEQSGWGITFTALCIVASQIGMLLTSILVGRRANAWGHRRLLAFGFAMLPIQALFTVLGHGMAWLLIVQLFGGLGAGFFFALTPIWLARASQGTGRYNLSQGVMGTCRALGVSSSGMVSELVVQYLGYGSAFIFCGMIGVVATGLAWFALAEPAEGNS